MRFAMPEVLKWETGKTYADGTKELGQHCSFAQVPQGVALFSQRPPTVHPVIYHKLLAKKTKCNDPLAL
jgi:hypothetical protein